jgi:hypothetical protein
MEELKALGHNIVSAQRWLKRLETSYINVMQKLRCHKPRFRRPADETKSGTSRAEGPVAAAGGAEQNTSAAGRASPRAGSPASIDWAARTNALTKFSRGPSKGTPFVRKSNSDGAVWVAGPRARRAATQPNPQARTDSYSVRVGFMTWEGGRVLRFREADAGLEGPVMWENNFFDWVPFHLEPGDKIRVAVRLYERLKESAHGEPLFRQPQYFGRFKRILSQKSGSGDTANRGVLAPEKASGCYSFGQRMAFSLERSDKNQSWFNIANARETENEGAMLWFRICNNVGDNLKQLEDMPKGKKREAFRRKVRRETRIWPDRTEPVSHKYLDHVLSA